VRKNIHKSFTNTNTVLWQSNLSVIAWNAFADPRSSETKSYYLPAYTSSSSVVSRADRAPFRFVSFAACETTWASRGDEQPIGNFEGHESAGTNKAISVFATPRADGSLWWPRDVRTPLRRSHGFIRWNGFFSTSIRGSLGPLRSRIISHKSYPRRTHSQRCAISADEKNANQYVSRRNLFVYTLYATSNVSMQDHSSP
jgi:hypothetical protein